MIEELYWGDKGVLNIDNGRDNPVIGRLREIIPVYKPIGFFNPRRTIVVIQTEGRYGGDERFLANSFQEYKTGELRVVHIVLTEDIDDTWLTLRRTA